jgi:hypothetical protein
MNELALFAGGGGSVLAGKLLGWRTVCAVEIDAGAREIMLDRMRDGVIEQFPIWDDVRTFNGKAWAGTVDVVTGGFPCQDISQCGGGLDLMVQDQDFGWRWPESFVKLDQNSFLWKTRQCSLLGGLEEFSQTWPEWGLMQDGECFTRPPLEQRTTERGFTWLLTPTAQSWKAWTFRNPLKLIRVNHADGNLQEQLMRLYQRMTTPQCQEILMMWPEGWTDSKPLAMDGFQQWLHEQCEF